MSSLTRYICNILETFDDHTVFVESENGKQISATEIIHLIQSISQYFSNFNYTNDDVICYFSPNCSEYLAIILGVMNTGATLAFGNPSFTEYETLKFISLVNPKCIIYHDSLSNLFTHLNIPEIFQIISMSDLKKSILSEEMQVKDKFEYKLFDNNHAAMLMSSSGTTGFPKPAMISHLSIIMVLQYEYNFDRFGQTCLGILPFYHIYGLEVMLDALCNRCKIITMSKFKTELFIENITKFQITYLPLVPSLFLPLSNILKDSQLGYEKLKSIKLITTGGTPYILNLIDILYEHFSKENLKIYNIYGMTESTGIISITEIKRNLNLNETFIGKMPEELEVKIIDTITDNEVDDNIIGELCLRGNTIFLGYKNNIKATKEILDEDNWLHTGDLVKQQNGFFYLVGRIKEIIKYQSNAISPYELENIFFSHPEIKDVSVIGIPHDIFGELPAAVVVLKDNSVITSKELENFVHSQVSPFKRLRGGIFICEKDFICRTISGKVKKIELLKKIQTQTTSGTTSAS